jgi:hypothetical protein
MATRRKKRKRKKRKRRRAVAVWSNAIDSIHPHLVDVLMF